MPVLGFEQWHSSTGLSRFELPGGRKTVVVRGLTGRDEEVLGSRRYDNPVDRVTDFLAGVIVDVDGAGPPPRDRVEAMLIGDRDFLILRLRQVALGDVVEQVLRCPNVGCGRKVDVEFRISEFELHAMDQVPASHEVTLSAPAIAGDETSTRVAFRLPTGADQREIGALADENPAAANTRLFARILLKVGARRSVDEEMVRQFPLLARRELTEALGRLSPGPVLSIDVQCPYCGDEIRYRFDVQRFFFDEWLRGLDRLYEEVHTLALHYHWAEESILAMPRHKRFHYLHLLAGLSQRRSAAELEA